MFFQPLSAIKVKLVDKMMQSNYLCVIIQVLDKTQDGDLVWYVTDH